jgi:hypothetical protein
VTADALAGMPAPSRIQLLDRLGGALETPGYRQAISAFLAVAYVTFGAQCHALKVGKLTVRGERSGITTGMPIGYVFRVSAGRLAGARADLRPEQALEAVGRSK